MNGVFRVIASAYIKCQACDSGIYISQEYYRTKTGLAICKLCAGEVKQELKPEHTAASSVAQTEATPVRYEYMKIVNSATMLRELGASGWELDWVIQAWTGTNGAVFPPELIMRREKTE